MSTSSKEELGSPSGSAWSPSGRPDSSLLTELWGRVMSTESPLFAAPKATKEVSSMHAFQKTVGTGVEAVKRMGMQKTDEILASSAGNMIDSVGTNILNSLHDTFMPRRMHKLVDDVYGMMWPEARKSLLDIILLDLGIEFQAMKQYQRTHDPPPPRNPLKALMAFFIYAVEPYDLSIWGTIRSPASFVIRAAFLFPFYGVSDLMVILPKKSWTSVPNSST